MRYSPRYEQPNVNSTVQSTEHRPAYFSSLSASFIQAINEKVWFFLSALQFRPIFLIYSLNDPAIMRCLYFLQTRHENTFVFPRACLQYCHEALLAHHRADKTARSPRRTLDSDAPPSQLGVCEGLPVKRDVNPLSWASPGHWMQPNLTRHRYIVTRSNFTSFSRRTDLQQLA